MIEVTQNWRPMWKWIEGGLWEIIDKTSPTWLPPDVYAELTAKRYVFATINSIDGFVIFRQMQDFEGAILFIWCLWYPGAADEQDDLMSELSDIAKKSGCVKLQMRSPRTAWSRLGWIERDITYERGV